MNLQKIFTVAAGMALLAGLAYHQGNNERKASEDDSILVGTAMDTTAQPQEIQETVPETAQSDQPDCEEGSALAAGPESEELCAPAEGGDDVSTNAEDNLKS